MNSTPPPTQITEAETFILESLSLEDEKAGRMDGKILYDTLKLHGKNPIYYYFRTQAELVKLAEIFRNSGYRYLHMSCHGDDQNVAFTFSSSSYETFAKIFEGKLNNRRIFVSGCYLGNKAFATALFEKNGGMYSLTAPRKKVTFDQTVAFWSAFYYLMHAHDLTAMKKPQITGALSQLGEIFELPVGHYFKNTGKQGAVDESVFGEGNGSQTGALAKEIEPANG